MLLNEKNEPGSGRTGVIPRVDLTGESLIILASVGNKC